MLLYACTYLNQRSRRSKHHRHSRVQQPNTGSQYIRKNRNENQIISMAWLTDDSSLAGLVVNILNYLHSSIWWILLTQAAAIMIKVTKLFTISYVYIHSYDPCQTYIPKWIRLKNVRTHCQTSKEHR